jgi:flagellar biosynthesis protein FlhF
MDQVRLEMGAEAIILSSQEITSGGVQLTAAVEQQDQPAPVTTRNGWAANWDDDWKQEIKAPAVKVSSVANGTPVQNSQASAPKPEAAPISRKMELLVQSMAYHGIPTVLAEKLCRMALEMETDDPVISLAASLDTHFKYASRLNAGKMPMMLVGPPGVGKTITLAKMAAAAKMEGRAVKLITTDTNRAGAVDQLRAYTNILEFQLHEAGSAEDLKKLLNKPGFKDGADILIDTGGINVYDEDEVADLTRKIIAAGAEPVVVLAAGTDTAEMSDMASMFASLGARRLIATRLDTTRRYGGLFTAAHTAKLTFSFASVSSSVATGLHVINPVNLARLLLRDPTQAGVSNEFNKVAS